MYEYHGNKGSRRQQEIKKPLTLYRAGGFLFISCRRYQTDHLQIYSGGVRILNVQLERKKTETGYQSCDVLFRLINGEDVPQKTTLKGEVVYRSSCGCTNHEEKHQNGKRHIIETMLNRNYVQNNFQILQKRLV